MDDITNALAVSYIRMDKRRAGPRGHYLNAETGVPHLYSIVVVSR